MSADVCVVQELDLEGEMSFQIFNDHHHVWKFNGKRFVRTRRTRDVGGVDVDPRDLQHRWVKVVVCDSRNVTIFYLCVPKFKWFAAHVVKDGHKSSLDGFLEHCSVN